MQQRAVPIGLVEMLVDYGARERASGGAEICFIDRKAKKRLSRDYGRLMIKRLSDQLNKLYAIVDGDTVITVSYRTMRIRRH